MKNVSSVVRERTPVTSLKRRVQIVSSQGSSGLDVAAFVSVFEEANRQVGQSGTYEISTVRFENQRLDTFRQSAGDKPLDILVVVAPADFEVSALGHDAVSSFKRTVGLSTRIVALGGGTFLLAALGLLNAQKVVVHWSMQDRFRKRFPVLESDGETLFTEDGRLFTCAGGVASLDCALAIVEQDLGSRVAGEVARVLLLPHRRGSDAAQMSSLLRTQSSIPDRFSQLLAWLPDNLQQDLCVRALAKRAAMSTRNFARIFQKRLGVTPALYVEHLRLQAAQRELHRSCASLPQVAEASGFNNPETLRRTFLKHLGITPGRFRRAQGHASGEGGILSAPIQSLSSPHRSDTGSRLTFLSPTGVDGNACF